MARASDPAKPCAGQSWLGVGQEQEGVPTGRRIPVDDHAGHPFIVRVQELCLGEAILSGDQRRLWEDG
jgi:hypothetical protein